MRKLTISLFLLLFLLSSLSLASVPTQINFQGVLKDSAGVPTSGEVSMTFQIYDGPDPAAASMWNETQSVTLEAGLYSVQLGSQNPITPEVFSGVPRYLGVAVIGEPQEMKPRILLVSVPYAFVSEVASRSAVTDSLSPAALQQVSNEVLSLIPTTAAIVPDPLNVNPPSGDGYQNIEGSLSVLAGGLNGIGSADAITGTSLNWGTGVHGVSVYGHGVYGYSVNEHGVIGTSSGVLAPSGLMNNYGGLFASGSRALGVSGEVYATGTFHGGETLDIAEWIKVSDSSIGAGDIVVIDKNNKNCVIKSSDPYSTLAAGIISTDPNYLAGNIAENNEILDKEEIEKRGYRMLALAGQVPCNVSTENGPIEIGDLLTTSNTPGYAMKVTDKMAAMGAIVGKALEPLASRKGKIMVLVTLQ